MASLQKILFNNIIMLCNTLYMDTVKHTTLYKSLGSAFILTALQVPVTLSIITLSAWPMGIYLHKAELRYGTQISGILFVMMAGAWKRLL